MPGLAGAVLCGGASSRMGTDKAQLVLEGERLVERAGHRLAAVADPVLIAPGRQGRIPDLPVAWVQLDDADVGGGDGGDAPQGPLAGIAAALAASPQPLVAVVAVDLVHLDPALLAWLAASWWTPGLVAVVPVDEESRAQPLHAVYSVAAAGPALAGALSRGVHSVSAALATLDVREVGAGEWGAQFAPGWSRNVNSPEDL